MKRILTLFFPIILFLSSCILNSNSTVILWTDKPEMAAYVEEFNSVQDDYKIEIVYKKAPGNTLVKINNQANVTVDLIISEFLNSPETIELFTPLEDVYNNDSVAMPVFYSSLLELGYKGTELFLLPVSFNLPAIMFKKSIENEQMPSYYMNSANMESASINFNQKSNANFEVMGFSQKWEDEFLFINAVLMKTNFKMLNTGILSWNNQKLLDSLEYIKHWSNEVNGGLDQEEEFTTKFLYDPSYKLIEESRILFYYSDIVNFFSIAPEKRKNLDFRWLAADDKIPVLGNILFSGIPEKSKNRKGAIQFIHWFFDPATQKNLLKSTQIKRMDTFGFANGFSSLPEINKNELPIIYPNLVGNIPQGSSLIFPDPLPLYWNELKTKVIKPWMYAKTELPPLEEPLQAAIEEWLKQRS